MKSGLLVAEEKLENIQNFILRIQQQEENLKEGFRVEYKEGEYDFVPEYIDRYTKWAQFVTIRIYNFYFYYCLQIIKISCALFDRK